MNTQQEIKNHACNAWRPVLGQGNIFCNKTVYSFKLLKNYYKDKLIISIIIIKLFVNLIYDITALDLLGTHFKSENKFGAQFEGLWCIYTWNCFSIKDPSLAI